MNWKFIKDYWWVVLPAAVFGVSFLPPIIGACAVDVMAAGMADSLAKDALETLAHHMFGLGGLSAILALVCAALTGMVYDTSWKYSQ